MKKLLFIVLAFVGINTAIGQELNATVNILLPQQVQSPPELFATMKTTITEFINSRKWSKDSWNNNEKIDCSLQITIEQQLDARSFKGSIQVTSSRPVYNSDYKTGVLNVNDRDFEFQFQENTMLQWSQDQHRDNLSSVLAFYCNLILAMDYDTFSMEGGTEYYSLCQTIVNNAQNSPEPGWRSNEKGRQNRYWIIENILTQTFKPIRECLYTYHRKGMDKMYSNPSESRKIMADALQELKNVHKIKPSSYNMQIFFYAKGDEIVNIFKPTPAEEKQPIIDLCKLLDPGNIAKYDRMM